MALSQRRRLVLGRLLSRRQREREGLVLVEGIRAVEEALESGVEVSFVVTSPKLVTTDHGRALAARLAGLDRDEVEDAHLAKLGDTQHPQGVLLVCREPADTLEGLTGDRFLVLDGVQDPGNVGTLVRSAAAFDLDGVIYLEGTADPLGAKAVRASAGAVFRRPVVAAKLEAALARLRELEVPLIVADPSGMDLTSRLQPARFALVVGNEGAGVRADLREVADSRIGLPMQGPVESLNAGVAGSILLHALTIERDAPALNDRPPLEEDPLG